MRVVFIELQEIVGSTLRALKFLMVEQMNVLFWVFVKDMNFNSCGIIVLKTK